MKTLPIRKRVQQLITWLQVKFPIHCTVETVFVNKPFREGKSDNYHMGECVVTHRSKGNHARVELNIWYPRPVVIDTLFHEWAHARLFTGSLRVSHQEDPHSPEFYLEYGRISEEFNRTGDSSNYLEVR